MRKWEKAYKKCEIIFETEKNPHCFNEVNRNIDQTRYTDILMVNIDINFEISKKILIYWYFLWKNNRYRIELKITDIAHHYCFPLIPRSRLIVSLNLPLWASISLGLIFHLCCCSHQKMFVLLCSAVISRTSSYWRHLLSIHRRRDNRFGLRVRQIITK